MPFSNIIFTNAVLINAGLLHSQFLSADTIWADGAAWAFCFGAVVKCQAEGLSWLPGPPFAAVYLAAEGVAALSIYLPAEVDGKFL